MHTGNGSGDANKGRDEHDGGPSASIKKGKNKRKAEVDEEDEQDDYDEKEYPNKAIKGAAKTKLAKQQQEENWDDEIDKKQEKIISKQANESDE